jgi:hypothetical protein
MHRVHQTQPLFHTALAQAFLNLRRDMNDLPTFGCFKPEFFTETFHNWLLEYEDHDKIMADKIILTADFWKDLP